jgi:hypothetical protein
VNNIGAAPCLAKVNLATFSDGQTVNSVLNLGSTVPGHGIARAGFAVPLLGDEFVLDAVHNFAYLATYNACGSNVNLVNLWPYNQAMVARIDLGSGDAFAAVPVSDLLNLRVGERDISCMNYDEADGDLLLGTDNDYPGHVYRVHVGDGGARMTELGAIALPFGSLRPIPLSGLTATQPATVENYGESFLRSSFFDSVRGFAYFGTDSVPGQVIKIGVSGGRGLGSPDSPAQTVTVTRLGPSAEFGAFLSLLLVAGTPPAAGTSGNSDRLARDAAVVPFAGTTELAPAAASLNVAGSAVPGDGTGGSRSGENVFAAADPLLGPWADGGARSGGDFA